MRHELSLISVAALAALGLGLGAPGAAAALPEVSGVELQPLAAQVKRVTEALDYLGAPLSPAKQPALARQSPGPRWRSTIVGQLLQSVSVDAPPRKAVIEFSNRL
jgi:hypothetical protein